jgi:GNAT superfamily N-acetyltransferase
MSAISLIRYAKRSERGALDALHRRSSFVWAEDRAMLEAHPDALGVSPDAIIEQRVRVAVGKAEEVLGFSVVALEGLVCELDDLFVDPDVMRKGIGRALVRDAAGGAVVAGCRSMAVVAHPRNFPFYESVGFKPGDPATTRFGPAVQMRLTL